MGLYPTVAVASAAISEKYDSCSVKITGEYSYKCCDWTRGKVASAAIPVKVGPLSCAASYSSLKPRLGGLLKRASLGMSIIFY